MAALPKHVNKAEIAAASGSDAVSLPTRSDDTSLAATAPAKSGREIKEAAPTAQNNKSTDKSDSSSSDGWASSSSGGGLGRPEAASAHSRPPRNIHAPRIPRQDSSTSASSAQSPRRTGSLVYAPVTPSLPVLPSPHASPYFQAVSPQLPPPVQPPSAEASPRQAALQATHAQLLAMRMQLQAAGVADLPPLPPSPVLRQHNSAPDPSAAPGAAASMQPTPWLPPALSPQLSALAAAAGWSSPLQPSQMTHGMPASSPQPHMAPGSSPRMFMSPAASYGMYMAASSPYTQMAGSPAPSLSNSSPYMQPMPHDSSAQTQGMHPAAHGFPGQMAAYPTATYHPHMVQHAPWAMQHAAAVAAAAYACPHSGPLSYPGQFVPSSQHRSQGRKPQRSSRSRIESSGSSSSSSGSSASSPKARRARRRSDEHAAPAQPTDRAEDNTEHEDEMQSDRTWMQFFSEVLQIGLIARLCVAGLWLTQGKTFEQRAAIICIMCAYYVYSVGLLEYLMPAAPVGAVQPAVAQGGAAAGANRVQGGAAAGGVHAEADTAAGDQAAEPAPEVLWYRQGLMYDLGLPLVAFVMSLSPEWRHPEPAPAPAAPEETAPPPTGQPVHTTAEEPMPEAVSDGDQSDGESAGMPAAEQLHRRQAGEEAAAVVPDQAA